MVAKKSRRNSDMGGGEGSQQRGAGGPSYGERDRGTASVNQLYLAATVSGKVSASNRVPSLPQRSGQDRVQYLITMIVLCQRRMSKRRAVETVETKRKKHKVRKGDTRVLETAQPRIREEL